MKDSFAKHNSIGNGHPYNYNGNNENYCSIFHEWNAYNWNSFCISPIVHLMSWYSCLWLCLKPFLEILSYRVELVISVSQIAPLQVSNWRKYPTWIEWFCRWLERLALITFVQKHLHPALNLSMPNKMWYLKPDRKLNSLALRRWGCNLIWIIFKLISRIDILCIYREFPVR